MSIKPTIFREYIGSMEGSKLQNFPDQIINEKVKEFHFILAFAKEGYKKLKGDGKFEASWEPTVFNGESIKKLKEDHPNVKVVISIGGPGDKTRFNIVDRTTWLHNATQSIGKIITDYNIDGIDINYETILSSTEDFDFCIGGLIQKLKKEKVITVASIAPLKAFHPHYNSLFNVYKMYIDWVDYKFYDQALSTTEKFVKLYYDLSHDYPSVLLAGFSTDPEDADDLSLTTFLDGCRKLIQDGKLPGIFVSDADYSRENEYEVEKIAQDMIVESN